MIKKWYLLFIMIICMFAISTVTAAEISNETNVMENSDDSSLITEYVNEDILNVSLSEEEIQRSDDEGAFNDLDTIIFGADPGSTIILDRDYKYVVGSTNGILIDKSLTIEGNGHVLDGLGKSMIFHITSSSVTLNNITFKNGHATLNQYREGGYGGAIFVDRDTRVGFKISIINGTFINNSADLDGGAIYFNDGVKDSIIDGNFINNTAKEFSGGAICFNKGIMDSIINGSFINNTAHFDGGAIQIGEAFSGFTVSESTINGNFINNVAKYGSGGAINIYDEVYNSVIGGEFINNAAYTKYDSGGAAININSAANNVTIKNSIFLNNKASSDSISLIKNKHTIEIKFKGKNNLLNALFSKNAINFDNVTYWGENGIMNTNSKFIPLSQYEPGQNITIIINNTGTINKKILQTDANGAITLDLSDFAGDYNITAYHAEDSYYTESNHTSINFTTRSPSSIDLTVNNYVVIANVTSGATGNVTFNIKKEDKTVISKTIALINSISEFDLASLIPGEYNITVIYNGDINYLSSMNNLIYNTLKNASVEVNSKFLELIVGETSCIYYNTIPEDLDVTFTSNDETVVSVQNKNRVGEVIAVGKGNTTITVTINEEVYVKNSTTVTVSVSKKDSTISISTVDINVTESDVIIATVTLPGNATGNVSVTIGDKNTVVEINNKTVKGINGHLIMPVYNLNLLAGEYNISATYNGNNMYNPSTANGNFTISKIPCEFNVINNDSILDIMVPKNTTGNIMLTIDEKTMNSPIKNGIATFDLSDIPSGNYNASISYLGDIIYEGFKTIVPISIEDKFIIIAENVTKYYKGLERFTVTLKDKSNNPIANANIKITINGRSSNRITDDKGIVSMAINLNSGVYTATTEYNGTKVNSTITVKDTVIANDFTKIFRNGTQYYGTFVDSHGNLIKNTDIKININGVFYTRTTDGNGVAKMNINLNPGTYILTATNPLSGEMHTTNVTVLPSIVENNNVVMYYKNGTRYQVKIIGDNGKPVGAGVKVTFNINGVIYDRTTDANGYAGLNINLVPGTYTITAEYNGLRASNTITVLSVLQTKDLSMKYKDGSKFEAKILDGQGKPYAGQTVTFNINGVFYQKTTGADGIASLNINLMAGDYIITSSYNGLNGANSITIGYDFWHLPDSTDPYPEVGRINYRDGWVGQIYNDNYKRTINLNTLEVYGSYGDFTALGIVMVADDGRYYYYDNGDFAYHGENYDSFDYHTDVQWWYNNLPKSVNPRPPLAQYFDILGPNGANGYVYYPDGTYAHFVNDIVVDSNHYVDKTY